MDKISAKPIRSVGLKSAFIQRTASTVADTGSIEENRLPFSGPTNRIPPDAA